MKIQYNRETKSFSEEDRSFSAGNFKATLKMMQYPEMAFKGFVKDFIKFGDEIPRTDKIKLLAGQLNFILPFLSNGISEGLNLRLLVPRVTPELRKASLKLTKAYNKSLITGKVINYKEAYSNFFNELLNTLE